MSAARKLAVALGGRLIQPAFDDQTPQTAKVIATVKDVEVEIDFLYHVKGVDPEALERGALEIIIPIRSSAGEASLQVPIMHPLHILESRIANVHDLKRSDDTSLRQLNAAPIILREFIREMLQIGEVREGTRTLQALFEYLRSDVAGRRAHLLGARDPLMVLESFDDDERIDERFRKFNLTAMRIELQRRRSAREPQP